MIPLRQTTEIVLATKNTHKIREIQEIFSELPIHFIALDELSNIPNIIEDGKSFEENAIKKASQLCQWTGKISLADDSGIEVDFLNGSPGIYSARFAKENATDEENNQKLLSLLKNVPFEKRKARYRCVIAVASPADPIKTEEGICEGLISLTPKGENGFGYDPIFFHPQIGKNFGEIDLKIKNKVSHRYHALQKIKPVLLEMIQEV